MYLFTGCAQLTTDFILRGMVAGVEVILVSQRADGTVSLMVGGQVRRPVVEGSRRSLSRRSWRSLAGRSWRVVGGMRSVDDGGEGRRLVLIDLILLRPRRFRKGCSGRSDRSRRSSRRRVVVIFRIEIKETSSSKTATMGICFKITKV